MRFVLVLLGALLALPVVPAEASHHRSNHAVSGRHGKKKHKHKRHKRHRKHARAKHHKRHSVEL